MDAPLGSENRRTFTCACDTCAATPGSTNPMRSILIIRPAFISCAILLSVITRWSDRPLRHTRSPRAHASAQLLRSLVESSAQLPPAGLPIAWCAETQSLPSFRSLDEVLVQFAPHFRPGLEDPRLYGRDGNAHPYCNLLHRAAFKFIKFKDAPRIWPELGKRFPQNSRSFFAQAVLLRVRRQVCYSISKRRVLGFGMLVNRDLAFPPGSRALPSMSLS